jgi:hypothetical protein
VKRPNQPPATGRMKYAATRAASTSMRSARLGSPRDTVFLLRPKPIETLVAGGGFPP